MGGVYTSPINFHHKENFFNIAPNAIEFIFTSSWEYDESKYINFITIKFVLRKIKGGVGWSPAYYNFLNKSLKFK